MVVKSAEQATDAITGRLVLFPRMDSERYEQLPETKQNLELLNGEVIMSPRPRAEHQVFIADLYAVLKPWVESHRLGGLFPDTDMRLDDDWTPAPDLAFVRAENLGRIQNGRIVGPADMTVEVLSPSNKADDRVEKYAAYARFGIDWYWIVDLAGRRLDEYQRVGGAYGNPMEVSFDQPFTPRLFPGLTIDLARLGR
jgi:Uma2 family endonuclease